MFGINSMSGYSSYGMYGAGSFMPDYAQINDVKLMTALSKGSRTSSSSFSSIAAGLDTNTASFLKEYQSGMTDLLSKANALRGDNPTGDAQSVTPQSSDSEVMTASARYRLTDRSSYVVDVSQLARAQRNASTGVAADGNDSLEGDLVIATNRRASPIRIDVGSVSGQTNAEKLRNIAKEINSFKGSGVSARVVTNEGQASLEISGTETGEDNGFVVSGSYAASSGLSAAAQSAQNARYTVAKQGDPIGALSYESSSNTVNIGGYKMQATFKKVGTSTINVAPDAEKTAGAVQDLVDSYNNVLKLLNNNADRGTGVLRQMRRMLQMPLSDKSLEKLGITASKDGTLKFDKATYLQSAKTSPNFTADLLSGSSGLANGLYQDARAGLNTSSASLTGQGAAGSRYSGASYMQMQNSYMQNPLNYMGAYSRNGINSLLNYHSVGTLMNINI